MKYDTLEKSVERSFRFLKEPAFMTSSGFLKSQKRIIALAVMMCLCLLVYMIAQRYLRHRLKQARASISNQLGKPIYTPTMHGIFQLIRIQTRQKISHPTLNRRWYREKKGIAHRRKAFILTLTQNKKAGRIWGFIKREIEWT